MNYLPFDAGITGPTINGFEANFPLAPTAVVEEGQRAVVTVDVSDDVQVRNVELFVGTESVGLDGNFPFTFRFIAPLRNEVPSFFMKAIASE